MSELLFKSRTGNARDKQQVYFSCHPDDFNLYFEKLTDEVLRIVDCAVYYYNPNEDVELNEDYYLKLNEMQMFIVPVTKKLLQEKSRTIDIEFPFATEKKRRIPVLPILCESGSGIESEFGKVCGNLQLLDRTLDDDTAISYEKKLEKRLQSVIVGEEMAERVRASFDAYIFLSYRKKDRRYARQLMQLIHENDFCRDIAIWYDEMLILGEDFNEGILDALVKSDLFALAVTPNLINEKNYVMDIEYPKAVENHKPILPVEMEPTDKKILREKYEGIPDCTNAHDAQALADELAFKLKNLAIRKSEDNPQHDFLIGIAYLNGIDVEVNRERALSLISAAGENGLIEALQKLRDMYLYGENVEPNIAKTVYWTRKLSECLEDQYRKEPTEENGGLWIKSLWDLGDYLYELGDTNEAFEAYDRMRRTSEEVLQIYKSPEIRRNFALSYAKLAQAVKTSDTEQSLKFYRRAKEHFFKLYEEEVTYRTAWDLAVVTMNYGNVICTENPDKALELLRESEKYLHEADSKSNSDRVKLRVERNLAVVYSNIGRSLYITGKLDEAKKYVYKSLKISKRFCNDEYGNGTVNSERDLGTSYSIMGDILLAEKQYGEAASYYMASIEIYQELYNQFNSHYDLELQEVPREKLRKIYKLLSMALEHSKQLYQMVTTEENGGSVTDLYTQIGDFCFCIRRNDEAERHYINAITNAVRVYETFKTVSAGLVVADCYHNLGYLYRSVSKPDLALKPFNESIKLCNAMFFETNEPDIMTRLVVAYRAKGDICIEMRNLVAARDYYKDLVFAATMLTMVYPENSIHASNKADGYFSLACVSDKIEREKNLREAISIWDFLSRQIPNDPIYVEKIQKAKAILEQDD